MPKHNPTKRDKAEIQAIALGVVVSWLRSESHASEELGEEEIRWAQEAQDRIAHFVDLEIFKLKLRSKTYKVRRSADETQVPPAS